MQDSGQLEVQPRQPRQPLYVHAPSADPRERLLEYQEATRQGHPVEYPLRLVHLQVRHWATLQALLPLGSSHEFVAHRRYWGQLQYQRARYPPGTASLHWLVEREC